MSDEGAIGIIGGSGLYEMEGLTDVQWVRVGTPFGEPSDELLSGRLGGQRVIFLPRHGRGHRIPPHRINYRANIHALKQLGVERIIAVSAVGSMREDVHPGDLVIVDQFVDLTKQRVSTFFDEGVAGHVQFADPVCADLAAAVEQAALAAGARVHRGGTYLCIEGPQFSTRAESRIYRSFGVDVIGMTNMPEAKLAREAEICYATIALCTDYDCWHESAEDVSVEAVVAVLRKNVSLAKDVIRRTVSAGMPAGRTCPCASAARYALITDRASLSQEAKSRLSLLLGRYLAER